MSDQKIVWVLGAGFSRPLGGPLLNELLSESRAERLRHSPLFDDGQVRRRQLPEEWSRLIQGWSPYLQLFDQDLTEKRRKPWADAEEFIEMLELEAESTANGQGGLLSALTKQRRGELIVADVARLGRRYIAAIAYEFTANANTKTERWHPYRNWASLLDIGDEVITFNYDLVVEIATESALSGEHEWHNSPRLHKLHGSVDEVFDDKQGSSVTRLKRNEILGKLLDPTSDPAIGVPGPAKQRHSKVAFDERWTAATAALRQAHAVVFLGYRFPPSDSLAKQRLLMALRENDNEHVEISIVLGPERSADVVRLGSLLRWTLSRERHELHPDVPERKPKTFAIREQPLWAEDFMTVFRREGVLSW